MTAFGIIFCAWESEEYLAQSLAPWIAAKETHLGGHTWTICVVSCPFVGFPQPKVLDGTLDAVREYRTQGLIDTFISTRRSITEVDARSAALTWLRDTKGVEICWQVDADEEYLESDILRITSFLDATPLVPWYRVSLRNAIFTKDQYLVEPFTPARIHRVRLTNPFPLTAAAFYQDNNVMYDQAPGVNRSVQRDTDLASMTIPQSVAWITHWSWLSTPRSRAKVEYQTKSRGWQCSFAWDDERGGLVFNDAFYQAKGLPLPQVARLSEASPPG